MIRVHIAPSSRCRKAIEKAIPSNLHNKLDIVTTFKNTAPTRADLVLHVGTGAPSLEVERFAARRGAYVICLPEATEWLLVCVKNALLQGAEYVLLDGTLAGTRQVDTDARPVERERL